MMLFNLVADTRLRKLFDSDDLIDLLFSPSLTPQYGTVLERYVAIYHEKQKSIKDKKWSDYVGELQSLLDNFDDNNGKV